MNSQRQVGSHQEPTRSVILTLVTCNILQVMSTEIVWKAHLTLEAAILFCKRRFCDLPHTLYPLLSPRGVDMSLILIQPTNGDRLWQVCSDRWDLSKLLWRKDLLMLRQENHQDQLARVVRANRKQSKWASSLPILAIVPPWRMPSRFCMPN